ncbi:MAG: hypothetical protein ACPG5P_05210, partial [Saprospiraceae bacterium]
MIFPSLKSLFYLKKSGVLFRLNLLEEAIDFNLEAVDWFANIKDTMNLGLSYGNIGALHLQNGQENKAKEYLELGLNTLKNTELENDGMIVSNLAAAYLSEYQPRKAIPLFESYLEETRKTNSKIHEVTTLNNLCSAYSVVGDYETSL